MWKNSDAQVGDVIILTKPLGTGIIATATKKGLAPKNSIAEASNSMKTLNKYAADALRNFTPNAVTDITGFGLLFKPVVDNLFKWEEKNKTILLRNKKHKKSNSLFDYY